jgi:hypothetical protein
MSGRAVWWRDGEKVRGFRKTNRRQGHGTALPRLEPWWRLSFMLPEGTSVRPDWDHGVIGLTIETIGTTQRVEIIGKNKDWLFGQAAALLRKLGHRGHITARLVRGDEQGPTISGPLRRGDDNVVELQGGRDGAITVIQGGTLIEFPGP